MRRLRFLAVGLIALSAPLFAGCRVSDVLARVVNSLDDGQRTALCQAIGCCDTP